MLIGTLIDFSQHTRHGLTFMAGMLFAYNGNYRFVNDIPSGRIVIFRLPTISILYLVLLIRPLRR